MHSQSTLKIDYYILYIKSRNNITLFIINIIRIIITAVPPCSYLPLSAVAVTAPHFPHSD